MFQSQVSVEITNVSCLARGKLFVQVGRVPGFKWLACATGNEYRKYQS